MTGVSTKIPTPAPLRPATLAATVRETITRVNRRMRQSRPVADLTITQISALASVEARGPVSPRILAEIERVQPPTMTRIVTRLEERGMVTRTPHPTDGRQVLLAISPPGSALLRDYRRARDEWLARRIDTLTIAERETLRQAAQILTRIATD